VATCSAGRCKITCPPGGCSCVYEYDRDACTCECFGEETGGSGGKLSLNAVVDVCVSGLPLGQFAASLDRMLARDVLVPASRLNQKVKLRLTHVPVSRAIKELGLTTKTKTKSTKQPRRR
jgi:hypothetical protein